VIEDLQDPRREEPPYLLGEREMLESWLEFHRTTLLLKCEGLTDEQRKRRPIPTSLLSLHGLVRHMAEVERSWFRRTLLGDVAAGWRFVHERGDDLDLHPLDAADWEADVAAWQDECGASRQAAARHGLDDVGDRHGEPCSLRWIYVHMVEEYARHNGHADLLRELVDASVGW
jgi:uncharacterized damage-inducible protein DinB